MATFFFTAAFLCVTLFETECPWRHHLVVHQPMHPTASFISLGRHGGVMHGIHAKCLAHGMTKKVWVDATLDFEF